MITYLILVSFNLDLEYFDNDRKHMCDLNGA